jgi:hypothetical protein
MSADVPSATLPLGLPYEWESTARDAQGEKVQMRVWNDDPFLSWDDFAGSANVRDDIVIELEDVHLAEPIWNALVSFFGEGSEGGRDCGIGRNVDFVGFRKWLPEEASMTVNAEVGASGVGVPEPTFESLENSTAFMAARVPDSGLSAPGPPPALNGSSGFSRSSHVRAAVKTVFWQHPTDNKFLIEIRGKHYANGDDEVDYDDDAKELAAAIVMVAKQVVESAAGDDASA